MARVELAEEVSDDLDRILDHLIGQKIPDAAGRIGELMQAIDVLEHSPYLGRQLKSGKRELIVGRRSHGYLVLYRYLEAADLVFVLGIRGQREAGYRR
jgi:toxin ParE1/3/4